ncbi:hypothetical protein DFH07DRAFT_1055372 [Mycena maculata]|uniref:Uncharacterized protein n=1 Tax=Mycena maculata TaxID=230809 RepID=A0AAD7KB73_9AGAR|nr:hypothetical protein DFH07DRAFT_1055372 [Mycena maculata]
MLSSLLLSRLYCYHFKTCKDDSIFHNHVISGFASQINVQVTSALIHLPNPHDAPAHLEVKHFRQRTTIIHHSRPYPRQRKRAGSSRSASGAGDDWIVSEDEELIDDYCF